MKHRFSRNAKAALARERQEGEAEESFTQAVDDSATTANRSSPSRGPAKNESTGQRRLNRCCFVVAQIG